MIRLLHSYDILEGEIFEKDYFSVDVEVANEKVKSNVFGKERMFAVRVLKDNRLGFSYSPDLVKAILYAKDVAKYSLKLDFSFANPGKILVKNKYTPIDKDFDYWGLINQILDASKGFKLINLFFYLESGKISIKNTSLLDVSSYYSYNNIALYLSKEEGLGKSLYSSYEVLNDPYKFVEFAKEEALLNKDKRVLKEKYGVVLDISVLHEFVSFLLTSFSGSNVLKNKSYLSDKLGKKVFSEKLNIKHSLNSPIPHAFDYEGISIDEQFLVKEGVISNFLYDRYTGVKSGTNKQGFCIRQNYECKDGVININILPKNDFFDKYIYINSIHGLHTANPLTGEFKVSVTSAYLFDKGDKFALKPFMLSGNIFKMFNDIYIDNQVGVYANLCAPNILFNNIKLVV